ncbi:hypothetical protein C7212DRAFT_202472 [Tuber magnatum]|uniref:Uncharacterized protein n=1 Tax=Tuber magnatum TaxID=42249 RepID=A0A317SM33_9PEZI|nr:hypothetical protein C7212DRAFT_202472 [Tuber magnatum]
MTQLLLSDERLDVNIRSPRNNTPLHQAIYRDKDRNDILSILLADKWVDPNLKNQSGLTPFHEAVKLGCESTIPISLTCPAVGINVRDPAGERPIRRVISLGWSMRELLGCCLKGVISILMPVVLVSVLLGLWRETIPLSGS